ncbi:glycoside hydrolase family 13 protein [Pseudobutyrivibrio xylanivorans]|uniref:Alpha-glucosidase n=1 Tax=Pseudobutyrivibrio xylanivorans DSM 14809 TaxID=1123012 RepID=A0A1M6DEW2_PSEXY|nr:glycoside hydrolase family 13 protein [Pseudobutyrivibrio xylanivorans]SHI71806.1 alpha-glucosidase [Pseudobutyrivibrio xylanivorans DSM 14809]
MNIHAIYSDGTAEYRYPMEPDENSLVTISIRVYHQEDVDVFLMSKTDNLTQRMHLDRTRGEFDFYSCTVQLGEKEFRYYFELVVGLDHYYYDRVGLWRDYREHYEFSIMPGFSTPAWSKGAVMYQILVDRFYNGDPSNDVETNEYHYVGAPVEGVKDWNSMPANLDIGRFYGGDLEGVRQKLHYLKSLGVEVIYFNPLFVSPSNHKYDTSDYDYIDPHFTVIKNDGGECLEPGDYDNTHATKYKLRVTNKENLEASNKFFADFVNEAHQKGIRVIIDGVFNHCGSFNKWLNREKIYSKAEGYAPGAYESKDSPYNSFFKFYEDSWPDNKSYDGWWSHDTLPKLNYEDSPKLYEYILNIGKKWVSEPYNCDGWRLDVAADLGHSEEFNHKFWRDFRDAVKSANPNAIILAEHYGNPSAWLAGDQWDTIMNYDAFMEPLTYFLTGMEKHSDEFQPSALGDGDRFKNTMLHFMARLKTPSLYCAMNQLSNHDHSRFLTRTNHTVGRIATKGTKAAEDGVSIPVMKLAEMIQFTWPGAPTLYYGDEAGVCGFTDPDSRRTYPWGSANYDLIDYTRDMIMIHKQSHAIKEGSFTFLNCGQGFISYGRFTSNEQIIVLINSNGNEINVDVPVWMAGVPLNCQLERLILSNEVGYSIMPTDITVEGGNLHISLGPNSGIVYKRI